MLALSNSRSDEKTEKEKKRHSSSPGKGKHVSPKVMFVHHDDPKVEENLRIRGKNTRIVFILLCVTFLWSHIGYSSVMTNKSSFLRYWLIERCSYDKCLVCANHVLC